MPLLLLANRALASLRYRLQQTIDFGVLAIDRIGWWGPARSVRLAWRHCRSERTCLWRLPFAELSSSKPTTTDAIRWHFPTRINGAQHHTLFAHPDSAVSWDLAAPVDARVIAWTALLPTVWSDHVASVRFAIEVTTRDGRSLAHKAIEVSPRFVVADRRWRRLVVPLGNRLACDVRITLRTTVARGACDVHAWSVWGDPQIEGGRWSPASGLRMLRQRRTEPGDYNEDALRYQQWMSHHTPTAACLEILKHQVSALPLRPLISIVMAESNAGSGVSRDAIDSVQRQVYDNWELCAAPAWNDGLAQATGDYVAFLDRHDTLAPEALAEVALQLVADPSPDIVYSDEDKRTLAGDRCEPSFKPDWSPEHFLGQMYTGNLTVVRTALARDVGGFRPDFEGAELHDLWLRMIARRPVIKHLPKVLYHARHNGARRENTAAIENTRRALEDHVRATAMTAVIEPGLRPGLWRVRRHLQGMPQVTIVIPSAGHCVELGGERVNLLARTIRSIAGKTSWKNYQILIADSGLLTPETIAAIAQVEHRRVTHREPGPFNLARFLNAAIQHVETDYFVILNDDVEIITSSWIEGLLEYAQDPSIGAVGCMLRYPDGRIQHVGVVSGVCGVAAHLFHQAPADSSGWNHGALTVRNYSIVTGAVTMTRRDVWDRVGGLDTQLRIDFSDVDYCLKLRAAGYRIVYTPFVELYHEECATLHEQRQSAADIAVMKRKWAVELQRDPYYNPNFSHDFPDCRLRSSRLAPQLSPHHSPLVQ